MARTKRPVGPQYGIKRGTEMTYIRDCVASKEGDNFYRELSSLAMREWGNGSWCRR